MPETLSASQRAKSAINLTSKRSDTLCGTTTENATKPDNSAIQTFGHQLFHPADLDARRVPDSPAATTEAIPMVTTGNRIP